MVAMRATTGSARNSLTSAGVSLRFFPIHSGVCLSVISTLCHCAGIDRLGGNCIPAADPPHRHFPSWRYRPADRFLRSGQRITSVDRFDPYVTPLRNVRYLRIAVSKAEKPCGNVAADDRLTSTGQTTNMPTMDNRDCLAHYPFVVVRIACRVCSRRGSYRLGRLAAKFGRKSAFATSPTVSRTIASGGPWHDRR